MNSLAVTTRTRGSHCRGLEPPQRPRRRRDLVRRTRLFSAQRLRRPRGCIQACGEILHLLCADGPPLRRHHHRDFSVAGSMVGSCAYVASSKRRSRKINVAGFVFLLLGIC